MACGDSASPLSPPTAAARDEVGTLGPSSEGASWAQQPPGLGASSLGVRYPRQELQQGARRQPLARSPARAPAALPPPLLAAWAAQASPGFVSGRGAATGCTTGGPGADRLRSPSATPPCTAGLPDWVAVTAAPRSNFVPLYSLLKVEAWGRKEKTQCRKGRCGLTCQRRRRKTPRSGRALEPAQGPEPWVRRRGGGGGGGGGNASARCPPSAGPALPRPPPPPGAALPAPSPGIREPPSSIFLCSFSKAPRKLVLLFHYL